jgi:hypothetical protein
MLRAGQALLIIGILAFCLILSNIAVVGPCTDTFGALALFAFILGTPIGLVLLVWSDIRLRRRGSLPSQTSESTSVRADSEASCFPFGAHASKQIE